MLDYNEIIYVVLALIGMILYSLSGWRKSGEPFDAGKFMDTLIGTGLLSIVVSAVALAPNGLTVVGVFTALLLPWGIGSVQSNVVKLAHTPPEGTSKCPSCGK